MFDSDKAKKFTDKFGDDAYRFAFIITLDAEKATDAVCGAFAALSADPDFDTEEPDKRRIFHAVCKAAKKSAGNADREKIGALYGEKCEEFYEIAALPVKERATAHLTLYEGYSETEAENIIKGDIHD